ncbi:alpha-N-arabinofuranosidase [Huintestinicola sp.]|uniref:alpha-N-arabinofuranosidase n=1 Tax=Huintestinicola sp. TaxID=2981661 RepID=UPI003D7D1FF0
MKKISMLINARDRISHINPELYGHFSEHLGRCIYNGIYVGENSTIPNTDGIRNDIIEAFRNIKLPVLRWPGGCFADEYHWKDGIGEKSKRKKMINTNWGGVSEDNSFGTHEFMRLCELVGCEPYIAGNLGSGTITELSEWVEYMTLEGGSPMSELRKQNGREKPWKLKYLGIGNENWGCGGNMRPEYYADEYRRYQSFCKNYSGNELFKIACGPNSDDYNWTETIMKSLNKYQTRGISLHYYTIPTGDWNKKGSAREFDNDLYYSTISKTLYMDELITRHTEIMNRYDPNNDIGLIVDEWGCWYDVEEGTNPGFLYQQNTMRDAIVAACNLNIFNRHSKRVIMANLAQAVNVLQSLILTEGEKMVKTPTYHVFGLFKEHQNGELVYCFSEAAETGDKDKIPLLSSSASVKDGVMTLTLANCSLEDSAHISCDIRGFECTEASARILTAEVHTCNDFDAPERVTPAAYPVKLENSVLTAELPPCSVVSVTIK